MSSHDQSYWVNSVHHLFYGGDFQELFQAIQDGFLEDKLVHLGPAALVEDYDYAFRATQSCDSPADLLLIAAHRTLMTSRAALLDQDFQDTLCRLSTVGAHRHWLSWCIGLAEFISDPPDKLALVSKLSIHTDGQDQARLLDTIRSASGILSGDIRKRFDVSRAIESLSLIGEPGLALCLEVLLPALAESPLQSLSSEVETVIKGLLKLPSDRAAPLLNRVHGLMDEKGTRDKQLYVALARAYFSVHLPQVSMMILEDIEGQYCATAACDYTIAVALLEAYASFEFAACRSKAAELSTKILRIARENKPPFENWPHLLSIAKLRSKIGLPSTSVAEALNETAITIYRPHEDHSAFMHPEPSQRCVALCSLAAESIRLGIPDMGQRLLMQAQALAQRNDRLGQRATELFHIACTLIDVGDITIGLDMARASIALFPLIKDQEIPHLRPGLEHDEALRRIIQSAAVFLSKEGDRDLLSSIFDRIKAVSFKPVQLHLLGSFTVLAARLPDPGLISLVLDEAENTGAAESDVVHDSERFYGDLIRACENASETVKEWLFPRMTSALLALSRSHHLTSVAKIAARTVKGKFGSAGIGQINQRLWEHGAAAKGTDGHGVLKALAAMAAEVESFDTCERAVERVFDNPIATSPDSCVRLLVLAAEACRVFGCEVDAKRILDHHSRHLLEMPDLVHRAEGQARLASAYHRVGERGMAIRLVESALLSMRENGKRFYGLFPYEFIAKACGELGDRDGSRLLIDSVNTAASVGDIMAIEKAINDFALACEGLHDRALALRVLDSLEDYGHRLLTLNPLAARTIPAHAIAPICVSRAHVFFCDSRTDKALESLLRSVDIARDLLNEKHGDMFLVGALARTCAECRKLTDPAAAAQVINAVHEVATAFCARRESRKTGDLYWRQLQTELAKTFLTIGEYQYADTAAAELHAEIVAGSQDFLGPSYLARELLSLLLHRHGIIRTDLLEMLEDEALESIATELVAHRASISADDRQAYFYAFVKVASRMDTMKYARSTLAVLPSLQSLVASPGVVDSVNRLLARIGVTETVG